MATQQAKPGESLVRARLISVLPPDPAEHGAEFGVTEKNVLHAGKALLNGDIQFDLELRVKKHPETGKPNFLGAWVVGPPTVRALYLVWRSENFGFRRTKIHLSAISWERIDAACSAENGCLVARIPGTRLDGSPKNGAVSPEWTVETVSDHAPISPNA